MGSKDILGKSTACFPVAKTPMLYVSGGESVGWRWLENLHTPAHSFPFHMHPLLCRLNHHSLSVCLTHSPVHLCLGNLYVLHFSRNDNERWEGRIPRIDLPLVYSMSKLTEQFDCLKIWYFLHILAPFNTSALIIVVAQHLTLVQI